MYYLGRLYGELSLWFGIETKFGMVRNEDVFTFVKYIFLFCQTELSSPAIIFTYIT